VAYDMKERIILIGAGQHCNVVIYNAIQQDKFNISCILDPDKNKWGKKSNFGDIYIEKGYSDYDVKFIESIKEKYKTNKFFISLGSMKLRKKLYDFFVKYGFEPVNIIHPNAIISNSVILGKGILIEAGCLVTPSPKIGDNVVINTGSQVNHDNIIEDHVYIASGVILSGGVHIKENTLIDDGVIITLGRTVGKNCIIGAGSVVTKDIEDNSIAYGSPCRIIRKNN